MDTQKNSIVLGLGKVLCLLIISVLDWYMLDISCNLEKEQYTINFNCILLNISILMIVNCIIMIIATRLWITIFISNVMCTIIGFTNFFVVQHHGTPFTIAELRNMRTAFDVLGNYKLNFNGIPIKLLITCIMVILCSLFIRIIENKKGKIKINTALCASILICGGYIFFCFYGESPIKPIKTIGWSWKEAYGRYGYVACFVEDIYSRNNIINKPQGYNYDTVQAVYSKYPKEINYDENITYPDIIFIVNETLYDLKHLINFETDVDYFKNIRDMDNLIYGYAVSPIPGGGTNSSEYELLTSNSLYLMNSGVTPFNVIDLREATSVVSHLKSLGYETLATHTEAGSNYNRITGYTDLGFDIIKFEQEYENMEGYYGRWYETDSSVYRNIEKWYNEMGEQPRFLYLLTIQNHGSWDLSDAEYDTVHITQSEFEATDTMNEYLTSISLSDEAFRELTEYFKGVNRPVIVCMVGDHCPSFAGDIAGYTMSEEEKELKLRETPLFIWANYPLDSMNIGSIGMPFVVPTLLKTAEVPLSGYYKYLLDVSKEVPIITVYGKYFDTENNGFPINEGHYSELVSEYFQVEYSNLKGGKQKDSQFFE